MATTKVIFSDLPKNKREALVKLNADKGVEISVDNGEITDITDDDILAYSEDFDVTISSVKVSKNAKNQMVLVVGFKKSDTYKFWDVMIADFNDGHRVQLNESKVNMFTDIRIANGNRILKELDSGQLKEIFRCYRGATGTVEVSMSETGTVKEFVLDRNTDLRDDVKDMLSQYTDDEDGI
jgi:hypothetical protein